MPYSERIQVEQLLHFDLIMVIMGEWFFSSASSSPLFSVSICLSKMRHFCQEIAKRQRFTKRFNGHGIVVSHERQPNKGILKVAQGKQGSCLSVMNTINCR